MVISERKIKQQLRTMIPQNNHIRSGTTEAIQEIMQKEFEVLCIAIVDEALASSGSNAITTEDVWVAYGKMKVMR